MLKKIFVGAMAAVFAYTPTIAAAENPRAGELREIINSSHYYIEYEVNTKEDKRALAVNGKIRKSFDCEGRRSSTLLKFVPIVGMFAKGSLKLMPEVYYDTNKYYQFVDKKKVLCATPAELEDPYINPMQEWDTIPLRIEIPEEFGMFTGDSEIKFIDSEEKFADEKQTKKIIVDKYVKNIRNVNGVNIGKKVYFVYYNEKNELDKILTMNLDWEEDASQILAAEENKKPKQQIYNIQQIKINKFTAELPEKIMQFPSGCKVYAPGLGDMNELLDMTPLLEEYKSGGVKK